VALSSSADPTNSGAKRLIATVPEVVGMLIGGSKTIRTFGMLQQITARRKEHTLS